MAQVEVTVSNVSVPGDARTLTVGEQVIKIGNDDRAHVKLDGEVGRMHAVVEQGRDGTLTLIDMGHHSGTYVRYPGSGRSQVGKANLSPSAVVCIGPHELQFKVKPVDETMEREEGREALIGFVRGAEANLSAIKAAMDRYPDLRMDGGSLRSSKVACDRIRISPPDPRLSLKLELYKDEGGVDVIGLREELDADGMAKALEGFRAKDPAAYQALVSFLAGKG